jgi:hypothetical protein
MSEFKQYRRTTIAEMRPWQPSERMDGISISQADSDAGSPKLGDMIARNPENHADQWLVAEAYFAANFVELGSSPTGAERYWEGRWRAEKAENDSLRAVLEDVLGRIRVMQKLLQGDKQ